MAPKLNLVGNFLNFPVMNTEILYWSYSVVNVLFLVTIKKRTTSTFTKVFVQIRLDCGDISSFSNMTVRKLSLNVVEQPNWFQGVFASTKGHRQNHREILKAWDLVFLTGFAGVLGRDHLWMRLWLYHAKERVPVRRSKSEIFVILTGCFYFWVVYFCVS